MFSILSSVFSAIGIPLISWFIKDEAQKQAIIDNFHEFILDGQQKATTSADEQDAYQAQLNEIKARQAARDATKGNQT
jgi:hypothetical protein